MQFFWAESSVVTENSLKPWLTSVAVLSAIVTSFLLRDWRRSQISQCVVMMLVLPIVMVIRVQVSVSVLWGVEF